MKVHEQRNLLLAGTFKAIDAIDHFKRFLNSSKFDGSIGNGHISTLDVLRWLDGISEELNNDGIHDLDYFKKEALREQILNPLCPSDMHDYRSARCWMCDQLTLYWELREDHQKHLAIGLP